MAKSDPQTAPPISLSIKNYPSTILLGNREYTFEFFTQNQLPTKEKYQFIFRGENFEVISQTKKSSKGIKFESHESKIIEIIGKPLQKTGDCALYIDVMREKNEVVTEIFWKARSKIEHAVIDPLLQEKHLPYTNLEDFLASLPKSIDLGDIVPISEAEAREKMLELDANQFEMDMEKDRALIEIARAVFMQAPKFGYETVHQIHNPNLRQTLLYHFLPIGMFLDYHLTLAEIMLIQDGVEQTSFLLKLARSLAYQHPKDAAMVALNIEDDTQRNSLLKDIIFTNSLTNPEVALNLVYQISDISLRNHVLFDLIKTWDDPQKATETLKKLISNLLSEQNLDFIRKCLMFLAHLASPEEVLNLMNQIEVEGTRDFLEKHLNEFLKIKVKERRTKVKMVPILQQFYVFSSIGDPISSSMQYLAELGGNISLDLLQIPAHPQLMVIAPYQYKFPLYQMLQQINFQVQQDLQQPLSFIVYPSKNNLDGDDWTHLAHIFDELKINSPTQDSHPVILLHLDFIPHFQIPTVIFGENGGDFERNTSNNFQVLINERLNAYLGNAINILWNQPFLGQGEIISNFTTKFPSPHFIVLNTLLTYNFLNDPGLLGAFFKALIPISPSITLPKKL